MLFFTMSNLNKNGLQGHPSHAISPFLWPILICIILLALQGALLIVGLAFIFSEFKGMEYSVSSLTLSDGVQVVIGTILLGMGFWGLLGYDLATNHHPYNPKFYADYLQCLLNRVYTSLEWCLNSPPKPHVFAGLPTESVVHWSFYSTSTIPYKFYFIKYDTAIRTATMYLVDFQTSQHDFVTNLPYLLT